MPTYAYQCQACAHAFDAFQKFSEAPLTDCPECAGRIRRVIHPTPVVFKGSGWYITDSRKPSPAENGSKSEPTSSSESDKADKTAKSGESSPSAEKPAAAAAV